MAWAADSCTLAVGSGATGKMWSASEAGRSWSETTKDPLRRRGGDSAWAAARTGASTENTPGRTEPAMTRSAAAADGCRLNTTAPL